VGVTNKLNSACVILLFVMLAFGCTALTGWSLTDTKWRGTNPDLDGEFIVEFHSGSTATFTVNMKGQPTRTFPANWSTEGKNLTITWSLGRFEGVVNGKQIVGNMSPLNGGTAVPMTYQQQ
jgi:hypothetical protein